MRRSALTIAGVALLAGCASLRGPGREARADECHFTVFNRTSVPLAIRHISGRTAMEIGAINPDEKLSATAPCRDGSVFLAGVPIPTQVGAPVSIGLTFASAELTPGTRATLNLHWP